jgi:hypothetical protein
VGLRLCWLGRLEESQQFNSTQNRDDGGPGESGKLLLRRSELMRDLCISLMNINDRDYAIAMSMIILFSSNDGMV